MFPSSRRSRQTASARAYQKESPPTPDARSRGDDSTYGVQSVSSWGGNSRLDDDDDCDGLGQASGNQEGEGIDGEERDDVKADGVGEAIAGGSDAAPGNDGPHGSSLGHEHNVGDNDKEHVCSAHSELEGPDSGAESAGGSDRDASPVIGHVNRPARVQSWVTPPSPEDTVHPLDRSSSTQRDSSPHQSQLNQPQHPSNLIFGADSGSEHRLNHLALDSLNHTNDRTPDSPFLPTSEPSSPASFTSMPSYVASLSSLSRTSSISPFGLDHYHDHDAHHHSGHNTTFTTTITGGSDELILPTLALPSESLSLHLSLSKWSGNEDSGLSVVLLGEREEVEKTLRGLRERCEMVETKGGVGLMKEGKLVVRIKTACKSIEQVQATVLRPYQSLNRLIHPDLQEEEGETHSELRRLVEGYVSRSDWVHLVISLGPSVEDHDSLVPIANIAIPDLAEPSQSIVTQSPVSRLAEIEPTPRPCDEVAGSGYFAPRAYTPSPTASRDPSPSRSRLSSATEEAIALISRIQSDPTLAIKPSIDAFLAWRKVQSHVKVMYHAEQRVSEENSGTPPGRRTMTSSMTSASSSYGTGGPMPTVARAQGGGEWEATLSRRVAQRRESVLIRERERARASQTFQSRASNRGAASGSGSGLGPLSAAGSGVGSVVRGRGTGRKRSIERLDRKDSKDKSCLPPLFPTTPIPGSDAAGPVSSSSRKPSISEAGLGVQALLEKTFSGVRQWTKGWRGFVVVAAVLVAVGWGCYASTK
ncbi:hypothetical protein I316_00041 [Kwoniella heveanensis BCC8398]|uniref:Uncharacterized protein n=1 Tax=Kwoniella heveanensis BCC8398 TaxID=1296120 RepID=A0A1B9H3I0_9TREE|nr:hypothetical protein I316_00041 [Kwoniella heveanensis BCC8398]